MHEMPTTSSGSPSDPHVSSDFGEIQVQVPPKIVQAVIAGVRLSRRSRKESKSSCADIAETETAHSETRCGVPLDNRRSCTKFDGVFRSAMPTGKREEFDVLISPLCT